MRVISRRVAAILAIAIAALCVACGPATATELPLQPARTIRFTTDEGTWISTDVAPKLARFTPHPFLDRQTRRREDIWLQWLHDEEWAFPRLAQSAGAVIHAGGLVGVGVVYSGDTLSELLPAPHPREWVRGWQEDAPAHVSDPRENPQ